MENINGNIMKPKELRSLIYELVLETLKEGSTYAGKEAADDVQKDPKFNTLSSTGKKDAVDKLKRGETVTIGEMARKPKGYEVVDPNIDTTPWVEKKVSGVSIADVIEYIKANPGIEKATLQKHFNFVRPQIANALVNALVDGNILIKSGAIIDPNTGEVEPEAEPERKLDAEDFLIGNNISKRGGLASFFEPEEESEEEPEIAPDNTSLSDLPRMSDEDYRAWMEYMKYKDRLARIKSALTQTRKSRKMSDDLSNPSTTEVERLERKKLEYEQYVQNLIDSNEYIKNRVEKEKSTISDQALMERFKELANIKEL